MSASESGRDLESGLTGLEVDVPAAAVVLTPADARLVPVVDRLRGQVPAIWSDASASTLDRDTPDLVILAPPDPSATTQVVRSLREHWKDQLVPVVVLLPSHDEALTVAAYESGIDFVWTPAEPFEELRARVQYLLRLRSVLALLIRSRERAKSRVRDHQAWARFLVHDMRTPLMALTSGIESLRDTPTLGDEDIAFCGHLLHEARRVASMVSDLLDHERLTDGQLQLQRAPTDLGELAERVVVGLGPPAAVRGVHLEVTRVTQDCVVHVDAGLLQRVLENLTTNAVRVSEPGSTVDLEVHSGDGWASILVLNTGPPIPADARETIFEPYVQLGSTVTRGARGLGLAFCRAAAQAHGGSIRVTEREGRTCFVVALPAAGPAR